MNSHPGSGNLSFLLGNPKDIYGSYQIDIKNLEKQFFVTNKIKIKLLSNLAKVPTKTNPEDAGWDLYSTQEIRIPPGTRQIISTGICLEIPNGYVGLIWPRSGLSIRQGSDILAGVVDAPYRGEIKVCIQNCDKIQDMHIMPGDRIAQIIFQHVPNFELIEVEQLSETNRGAKGFGSSGH